MGTTSKNPEIPKSLSGKYEDRLWRSKYLTCTQRVLRETPGRNSGTWGSRPRVGNLAAAVEGRHSATAGPQQNPLGKVGKAAGPRAKAPLFSRGKTGCGTCASY